MPSRHIVNGLAVTMGLFSASLIAGVPKDLPMPAGTPSADELYDRVSPPKQTR